MQQHCVKAWALWLLSLAAVLHCGCSNDDPRRRELHGAATLDGEPIPFGWIVFSPERGPAASADIQNGAYSTPPGFGAIGGPHTVEAVVYATPPADGGQPSGVRRFVLQCDIPPGGGQWDLHFRLQDLAPPE